MAEEKKVDLSYEVRREGQTLASEDEIHEIIYNLTENAIKYNHPGGFVKLALAGDEDNCLLTVSDDGIGIPEEDMPRIFDRFYRVDKMRSRAAGGTGLGLSIAADTARRRGGSIEVRARGGRRHSIHRAPAALQRGRGGTMKKRILLAAVLAMALTLLCACAQRVQEMDESGYEVYFLSDPASAGGEDAICAPADAPCS